MDSGQSARARAIVAAPATITRTVAEERVQQIADMMLDGKWQAPDSHVAMMSDWGVTRSVVDRLAAEAGRSIRRGLGPDADSLVGVYIAQLGALMRGARVDGKWGDAVRAVEVSAKLLKLIEKPNADSKPPEWGSLTNEQRLARIAEGRAKLDALEMQVRSEMATSGDAPR